MKLLVLHFDVSVIAQFVSPCSHGGMAAITTKITKKIANPNFEDNLANYFPFCYACSYTHCKIGSVTEIKICCCRKTITITLQIV